MSDALIIATVLLVFIALWGAIVFLVGWKSTARETFAWRERLRRFWIVVFAACGFALLIAVLIRTSIPHNAAIQESTRLALESPQVQLVLGSPIRYGGLAYGHYRGIGEGGHLSAAIALRGSRQSAVLHACGTRVDGQWLLRYAEVIAENRVRIALTPGVKAPCD